MGTYDPKKVLSDYANGTITVEMAMGHAWQHINKLYDLQTTANVNRYELRGKIDTLAHSLNAVQEKVDRLTALVKKALPGPERNKGGKQQKKQP